MTIQEAIAKARESGYTTEHHDDPARYMCRRNMSLKPPSGRHWYGRSGWKAILSTSNCVGVSPTRCDNRCGSITDTASIATSLQAKPQHRSSRLFPTLQRLHNEARY